MLVDRFRRSAHERLFDGSERGCLPPSTADHRHDWYQSWRLIRQTSKCCRPGSSAWRTPSGDAVATAELPSTTEKPSTAITCAPRAKAERMSTPTCSSYTSTATSRYTAREKQSPRMRSGLLEPCARKPARTVLRGGWRSDAPSLPGGPTPPWVAPGAGPAPPGFFTPRVDCVRTIIIRLHEDFPTVNFLDLQENL